MWERIEIVLHTNLLERAFMAWAFADKLSKLFTCCVCINEQVRDKLRLILNWFNKHVYESISLYQSFLLLEKIRRDYDKEKPRKFNFFLEIIKDETAKIAMKTEKFRLETMNLPTLFIRWAFIFCCSAAIMFLNF